MRAADLVPATYKGGRYLRRWSLLAGFPRCVLPPLDTASAPLAEIAATEAENDRLHALLVAVEAHEAAYTLLTTGQEADNPEAWAAAIATMAIDDPATVGLFLLRGEATAPTAITLALVAPGGAVENVVVADSGWTPAPPLAAVTAGPGAQAGGTYAGGVFAPPPPRPAPVPATVTNFQARAVLRGVIMPDGKSLETFMTEALRAGREAASVLPEADPARIGADRAWLAWEQSNEFERSSPLVGMWVSQLGMTDDQVDELFRQAGSVIA